MLKRLIFLSLFWVVEQRQGFSSCPLDVAHATKIWKKNKKKYICSSLGSFLNE